LLFIIPFRTNPSFLLQKTNRANLLSFTHIQNPIAQLEQLRRSSINTAAEPQQLLVAASPDLPTREMPGAARLEKTEQPSLNSNSNSNSNNSIRGRATTPAAPPRIDVSGQAAAAGSSRKRDDSEEGPNEYSIA